MLKFSLKQLMKREFRKNLNRNNGVHKPQVLIHIIYKSQTRFLHFFKYLVSQKKQRVMFSVTLPLVKTTAPIKFESVEPKEGSIKCTPLIPGFYQKRIVFVASKEFHKLARCVINLIIHLLKSLPQLV